MGGNTRRDRDHFASLYAAGAPPWDTGRPGSHFLRLADEGILRGRVLDAGCGTGENALALAERGCRVVGVDFVPAALAAAREKAAARGLAGRVEFHLADILAWSPPGGERFDAVLDSGLFHVFEDPDRARYVRRLAELLGPGGRLALMCFSDREPGDHGPRRVTGEELRGAFRAGWRIDRLERTRFDGPSGAGDGPRAWLLVAIREPAAG